MVTLATLGCRGDDTTPSALDLILNEYDVYIAGRVDDRALYWKNGEINYLTEDGVKSRMVDMDVSGSDVYMIGSIQQTDFVAVYWKNGELESVLSQTPSAIYTIAATESDVYASLYEDSDLPAPSAKIWKGGGFMPMNGLNSGSFSACIEIEVSGSDVYAIGLENVNDVVSAKYWKNGALVEVITGSPSYSFFTDISVSGDDVHLVGYVKDENDNTTFKYFKNGIDQQLSSDIRPHKVKAYGDDVYMLDVDTEYYTVNGEKVFLESGLGTGERYSARELVVVDGNVFVAAMRVNADSQHLGGHVWMNGELLPSLSIDLEGARFYDFALVKK